MNLILIVVLVTVLVVFGTRLIGRPIPLVGTLTVPSRAVFLFLGVLIGPQVLGLVDVPTIRLFDPVVVIGLGWAGFLVGVNLERRALRRLSPGLLPFTFGESCITFAVLAAAVYAIASALGLARHAGMGLVVPVLALAACGSSTAQAPLLSLRRDRRFRGPTARAVQVAATLDDLPALAVVAGLCVYKHALSATGSSAEAAVTWIGLELALGFAVGALLKFLVDRSATEQVDLVIVVGTVSLAGGAAGMLGLSPLLICTVAGAVFVNWARREEKVFPVLARSEFTIYVLFLVLVGCQWKPGGMHMWALVAAFLVARTAGKALGGYAMSRATARTVGAGPLAGLALLPHGGLSVALAVDLARIQGHAPTGDLVLTVVVLAILFNGLYSLPVARWAITSGTAQALERAPETR